MTENNISQNPLQLSVNNLELATASRIDFGDRYTLWLGIVLTVAVACTNFLAMNNNRPLLALFISLTVGTCFTLTILTAPLIASWLVDLSQQRLYHTRWISLAEFADLSPQSAIAIKQFCLAKNLTLPRIGIMEVRNPTIFIYNSLFGARLVISRSLFEQNCQNSSAAEHPQRLTFS